MQRWLSRSLATTVTVLLLIGGSVPATAEPTPPAQSPSAQEADQAERRLNEVILPSGSKATLKVVPVAVALQIEGIEKSFTAKNPFIGKNVEYRLDPLETKSGPHLVAQLTDGDSIHAWVLIPEADGPRVVLEVQDVQTIQLRGDLLITGAVRAKDDTRSTVGSRMYRYSAATGQYEATQVPGGAGGASYPIPPDVHADEKASTPAPAAADGLSVLGRVGYPAALLLAVIAVALVALLIRRRPRQQPRPAAPPVSPLASGTGPVVALTDQELADLADRGLQNPVAELVQSLAQRTDLIPFPAEPGQAVTFAPPEQWVITQRWVIAPFHDGRSAGRSLWRYTVSRGTVTWSLLDIERA